jgi:signal transduction histidine kinase
MFRNKTKMTVTTNDRGQQNMFAREPKMYISDEDAIKYGMMTHNERAELANGKFAMLGFVAGLISYATTGHLFFGVV